MKSRTPFFYNRTTELVSMHWPGPRLDIGRLLVHKPPKLATSLTLGELRISQGTPPPDSAKVDDWMPPTPM